MTRTPNTGADGSTQGERAIALENDHAVDTNVTDLCEQTSQT